MKKVFHFSMACDGEWVTAISGEPEGDLLVTGSDKGSVKIWNLAKEPFVARKLKQFSSPVTALVLCPKGDSVIVGTWNGDLLKVGLESGKVLRNYEEHRETITALKVSPDGNYLASGSADDRLIVWDITTGEDLLTMHQGNEYDVTTMAFSPDGKTIATGDGENQIKLWDADNGEAIKVLKGHREPVSQVAYDSKGTLISGSWDRKIRIWRNEGALDLKDHTGEITALQAFGDKIFSASEDGTVRIWNIANGKSLSVLKGAQTSIRCLAVMKEGELVLAGSKGRVFGWRLE
jgi:WD40 repeat protein